MQKKIQITKEQEALFKMMKSLAKRANQRIVRLEREFGENTYIVSNLKESLDITPLQAWSEKGRVRASKKFSETQMRSIIKATSNFLKPESTKRGFNKMKQKGIETIKTSLGTDVSDISTAEAIALYYIFEDKEVNKITNYIPGSDVLAILEESRQTNDNYEIFRGKAMSAIKYNKGKPIENLLKKIYVKYINKSNQNEIEIVNQYIVDLINSASYSADIEDIENIINNYKYNNRLTNKEYNYLIDLLRKKENEIIQGI